MKAGHFARLVLVSAGILMAGFLVRGLTRFEPADAFPHTIALLVLPALMSLVCFGGLWLKPPTQINLSLMIVATGGTL